MAALFAAAGQVGLTGDDRARHAAAGIITEATRRIYAVLASEPDVSGSVADGPSAADGGPAVADPRTVAETAEPRSSDAQQAERQQSGPPALPDPDPAA